MNLGFGDQWMLSKQVAPRTGLRGYLTPVNSSGGFFWAGGSVVYVRGGDTMTQVESILGCSFRF